MHTMHITARKLVDRDCALILIGYRISCLCGLPSLGAGSLLFKPTCRNVEYGLRFCGDFCGKTEMRILVFHDFL